MRDCGIPEYNGMFSYNGVPTPNKGCFLACSEADRRSDVFKYSKCQEKKWPLETPRQQWEFRSGSQQIGGVLGFFLKYCNHGGTDPISVDCFTWMKLPLARKPKALLLVSFLLVCSALTLAPRPCPSVFLGSLRGSSTCTDSYPISS